MAAPPSRIPPNVARLLPSTQMSYKAQVVWCLRPSDNDLSYMSQTLHGKRMAANEGSKSMIAWGPTAQFPQLPPGTESKIRLYVVSHGAEVKAERGQPPPPPADRVEIQVEDETLSATDFFNHHLKGFVERAPQHRVKRISLVMCNSAGIFGQITAEQSFAKQLADRCGELTTDVVGRQGVVDVKRVSFEKAEIDGWFAPDRNCLSLHTFEARGRDYSMVHAKKVTYYGEAEYHRYLTYVFEPSQPPKLKPQDT